MTEQEPWAGTNSLNVGDEGRGREKEHQRL